MAADLAFHLCSVFVSVMDFAMASIMASVTVFIMASIVDSAMVSGAVFIIDSDVGGSKPILRPYRRFSPSGKLTRLPCIHTPLSQDGFHLHDTGQIVSVYTKSKEITKPTNA